MSYTEAIEKIRDIIFQNSTNFSNIIHRKENSHILQWIEDNIPEKLKTQNYNLSTILYWILNDLTDFPKCDICGKPLLVGKNIRLTKGYPKYCNHCVQKSPECIAKRKEMFLKKYGVDNPFKSKEIIAKIRDTNLKKYGNACPAQSQENRKHTKENNIKRYGTEFYQSTEEFKTKVKKTCLEKYGVSDVFHSEDVRKKTKDTLLERYGVVHNMKSNDIKNKMKRHLIKKYGKNYKIIIWGNKGNVGQTKRSYKFILNHPNVEPLFSEDEFVSKKLEDINSKFKFRCKKCGAIFESVWDNGAARVCPVCNQSKGTSEVEKEMYSFISSLTKNPIIRNDRTLMRPYELDIVDTTAKICFEMDGLYWHCDDNKQNHKYHLIKTERCEELGYQLIHVFENEWIYKNEIVKSRISNLYGIYAKKFQARKCTVREIKWDVMSNFLIKNHIQGSCVSTINLGLYSNDELISVMSFGKSRYDKKYEWELLRFCNALGYHVIGGAGKLLKYFENKYNPQSLISYADRRWSKGNLYYKLGFTFLRNTPPNYWYIDFHHRLILSRVRFQKHKLKKILNGYDDSLSECENMKNNGYGRIFDCGNMVFLKQYNINDINKV